MTTEKSLETRKDIDCLKFHTKTWLAHLEALESYHKNGEHASFFDKEKPAINNFWFNEHYRKGIVEIFDLYEGLEEHIKWLQKELKEAWSEGQTHIEAMWDACEWGKKEKERLEEELDSTKTTLLDFVRRLAEEKVENMKLVEQSKEYNWALKNLNERLVEEKQNSLKVYLDKPLPKLPSKFKIFKRKVKTKFQHLVEKVKSEKQELEQKLIAKIEVKIGSC